MTGIIAIETATEACSAALLIENNGEQTLSKRFSIAPREHTKLLLPMLDEVLAEAGLKLSDVDGIAFGRGPGAFTGLRIATGVAQGLALSVDKPTLPVSSLSAMALAAKKQTSDQFAEKEISIIVAIDARMGEVYWAEYTIESGNMVCVGEEQVSPPELMFEQVNTLKNHLVLIGSGWDEYLMAYQKEHKPQAFTHISNAFPDAEEIAQLALIDFENGKIESIENAQPVYLRNNVAEKSKKTI